MKQRVASWLLTSVFGFRCETDMPWPKKCVIALAPHTSNWDFIIAVLYMWAYGEPANFLMKSEWFFWPMGYLMRSLGGIPVYRRGNTSMTDQLAEKAREMDVFHLAITPEGTRRATTEWRKGFFFIAQRAGIPILPYGLDFGKRLITSGTPIYPTPDTTVEDVMAELKVFYRGMQGKYPDQFVI